MESSNDYWTTYVRGIQPVSLPWKIDQAHGSVELRVSTTVPFQQMDLLEVFADKHGLSTLAIVKTAWIIVLSCYLGSEEVYLPVHHLRKNKVLSGLCRTTVEPDHSILDIAQRLEADALESEPYLDERLDGVLTSINSPILSDICNSALIEASDSATQLPLAVDSVCYRP